jgi:hypothetical protein
MRALFLVPILGLSLAGCGSSGPVVVGTTAPPTTPTGDPEGLYTGTIQSTQNGTISAYAAVQANGQIRYAASTGACAVASLDTDSGNLFSSGSAASLTLSSVTVTPGDNITGSYAVGSGDSGTFTFTYNSLYLNPVALAALAGSYTLYSSTSGTLGGTFSLDSSGNITYGGLKIGSLSQITAADNLYSITINDSNGMAFTGLAFYSGPSNTLVPYSIYMMISNSGSTEGAAAIYTNTSAAS